MALQPFIGPWPLQFRNLFALTIGLLGQVISPSQGLYLNTGQHKHRIIIFYYWWGGTKSLGTAATSGLIVQPQMIDEDDCGAIGGMKIGRRN
jgi:hypothetical protein